MDSVTVRIRVRSTCRGRIRVPVSRDSDRSCRFALDDVGVVGKGAGRKTWVESHCSAVGVQDQRFEISIGACGPCDFNCIFLVNGEAWLSLVSGFQKRVRLEIMVLTLVWAVFHAVTMNLTVVLHPSIKPIEGVATPVL